MKQLINAVSQFLQTCRNLGIKFLSWAYMYTTLRFLGKCVIQTNPSKFDERLFSNIYIFVQITFETKNRNTWFYILENECELLCNLLTVFVFCRRRCYWSLWRCWPFHRCKGPDEGLLDRRIACSKLDAILIELLHSCFVLSLWAPPTPHTHACTLYPPALNGIRKRKKK